MKRLQKPILKDTVEVPRKGGVQIYFTPNNEGWWFFHCHIEWHLATGMAIVIREGDPKSPGAVSGGGSVLSGQ